MLAALPLPAVPPTLLMGRRIAVLGSGSGLGLAVARAAEAAGAEVLGIDPDPAFAHVAELYRADPGDGAAMEAVAAALPEGLDGLALFPDLSGDPARVLAQGVMGPRLLAEALAPRLAPGAAIVARAAPATPERTQALPMIRAALALRPDGLAPFPARWGLDAEPGKALALAGWAMAAWVMARAHAWPGLRVNAVAPAAPDGRLPPALAARMGRPEAEGAEIAARATLFLLSGPAQGLTGAVLAADGGLQAQIQTSLEGL